MCLDHGESAVESQAINRTSHWANTCCHAIGSPIEAHAAVAGEEEAGVRGLDVVLRIKPAL